MGRMGSFDAGSLRDLQRRLNQISEQDVNAFLEACAKELAARLLATVIKRTPVGRYTMEVEVTAKRDGKKHKKGEKYKKRVNPTGRHGGTLRWGWIVETQEEAESKKGQPNYGQILDYADGVKITRSNGMIKLEIINPVEYANYVEFGHRQTPGRYIPAIGRRLKKAWVPGKLMMTISEQEIREAAPGILEHKVSEFMREHMQ